jgi:hypothetical protein
MISRTSYRKITPLRAFRFALRHGGRRAHNWILYKILIQLRL